MRKRSSTIGELMTPAPVRIRPEQSLATAHSLMRSHGIHHLAVDRDGLAGIFTSVDAMLALKQMTSAPASQGEGS